MAISLLPVAESGVNFQAASSFCASSACFFRLSHSLVSRWITRFTAGSSRVLRRAALLGAWAAFSSAICEDISCSSCSLTVRRQVSSASLLLLSLAPFSSSSLSLASRLSTYAPCSVQSLAASSGCCSCSSVTVTLEGGGRGEGGRAAGASSVPPPGSPGAVLFIETRAE